MNYQQAVQRDGAGAPLILERPGATLLLELLLQSPYPTTAPPTHSA